MPDVVAWCQRAPSWSTGEIHRRSTRVLAAGPGMHISWPPTVAGDWRLPVGLGRLKCQVDPSGGSTGAWHTAEHAPSQAPPRGALADARTHRPGVAGPRRGDAWPHGQDARPHLIVSRPDETVPIRASASLHSAAAVRPVLYERNRWEPLPYEGTLNELVAVMNTDLAAWAADWPSP